MSIEAVKAEIARFLTDSEPGVLCLRGKWGVGKTYAWNAQLKAALSDGTVSRRTYAYVSLFESNSLDQLKLGTFEQSHRLGKTLTVTGIDTLDDFIENLPSARKAIKAAASGSIVSRFISGDAAQAIAFGVVRDQLVCLDDFERRGDGLKPKDVLGLVSLLREQRNCKIALILNDESLDGEAKREFETHLEKVVDVSLMFRPTPAESAAVGAPGLAARRVAAACEAPGVTNIRTIRRALALVTDVERRLAERPEEVLDAAIRSLVLFCWCRDHPDEAPSLDFLASQTEYKFAEELDQARPELVH